MKNQETPKVNGKNWNEMMERELGEGYSFIKKKCFVCGSLSHLIRDCDFYEKKMAREAELKEQRVFNMGNWGTAIKTSAGYNWRNTRPNSNCNSGSNFVRTVNAKETLEDRGIFDSGCSGHMTGNKDHLDDFEECKGGSVTFGAIVKLVKKVKKMEVVLKRRHVVLTDSEDEDAENSSK
ncbi:ribonuclease H-like domain-containing protein [Tanacetum coccineum]